MPGRRTERPRIAREGSGGMAINAWCSNGAQAREHRLWPACLQAGYDGLELPILSLVEPLLTSMVVFVNLAELLDHLFREDLLLGFRYMDTSRPAARLHVVEASVILLSAADINDEPTNGSASELEVSSKGSLLCEGVRWLIDQFLFRRLCELGEDTAS